MSSPLSSLGVPDLLALYSPEPPPRTTVLPPRLSIGQPAIRSSPAQPEPAAPRERTWSELAGDVGTGILKGGLGMATGLANLADLGTGGAVSGIVKGIGGLADRALGGPGEGYTLQEAANRIDEDVSALESAPLRQRRQQMQEKLANVGTQGGIAGGLEKFWASAKATATDPMLLGQMAAEQIPLLATMGAGTVGTAAKAGAVARAAGMAPELAAQIGARAATRANIGFSGALGAGYASQQAAQEILRATPEQLAASPDYRALIESGLSDREARAELARQAGYPAAAIAGPVSALTAGITAPMETAAFLGQLPRGIGPVAGAMGREAIEEIPQESSEQIGANVGLRQAGIDRGLWEGVPEAAGAAGVAGGMLGAALGGVNVSRRAPSVAAPGTAPPAVETAQANAPLPDTGPISRAANLGIAAPSPLAAALNPPAVDPYADWIAQQPRAPSVAVPVGEPALTPAAIPQPLGQLGMTRLGMGADRPLVPVRSEGGANAESLRSNQGQTRQGGQEGQPGLPQRPIESGGDLRRPGQDRQEPVEPSQTTSEIGGANGQETLPAETEVIPATLSALTTQEVPVSRLRLSEDVPQFKSEANPETGVVEPLGGKYERVGTAPIIVWDRADGRLEVISGRHRLDLARRSGERTIPAQVLREADGFTAQQAAILDAELNIRDGQGKVKDYVNYFQHAGLSKEEADLRGLVSRSIGQRAFAIANEGAPGLIAAHRADQLTDEAAWRIAQTAPGNERLQAVGIKAVQDGKSLATATNLMQAVKAMAAERGATDSTADMFGFEDSAMRQAEAMAKVAASHQRQLSEQLAAVQGAAKRPEQARTLGVDVADPQAVLAKIAEIKAERDAWANWSTNPELVARIRERTPSIDEASGRVIRYARSSVLPPGKKNPGMPPERVKAIADDFLKGLNISDRSNLNVEIGPDLPHFFGAGVDLGSPNASGFFLPAIAGADPATDRGRNVVGLVATAFPAEAAGGRAAVERTLRHEILAHYGLNILSPDKKRSLLDHLKASKNLPGLRKLAQAVDREYADQSDDMRAEELFARAAEQLGDGSTSKAWDRIVSWLTAQLRKIGLLRGKITRAEVNMTLRAIAEGLRRGNSQKVFPANRQAQFSRAGAWTETLPPEVASMAEKIGADPLPLRERLGAMRANLGTRLRQGMVDRFARLLDLDQARFGQDVVDSHTALSAWVAAKMSKSAEGALEGAFLHGRLKWEDGALNVQETKLGLAKVLEPVAQAGELNRFWQWIIAHRSQRLMAEGREHLFTPAEIAAGVKLNAGTMANGSSREQAYRIAFTRYVAIQKSVLDVAEQAGLVNAAQRAQWEHDFYLPFYRVIDDAGEVRGPTGGGKLVRQKAFERLKGGTEKLGDPLQNILRNWHHLIDASLKNRAATLALDTAEALGVAEAVPEARADKHAVWIMKAGDKVHYQVSDPLTLEAISAISSPWLQGAAVKALAAAKRTLTQAVTISPAFKARNLLRDSISALAVSRLSPNAFANVARGFRAAREGSASQAALLAGGGIFRFGSMLEGDSAAALRRIAGWQPDTVLDSPAKIRGLFDRLKQGLDGWNRFGDRLETANRAALYEQLRQAGKTHLQAALAARDLMDFAQSGGWPATRFLIAVAPFLNARVQGLDVLYRKGFKPLAKTVAGRASAGEKQQALRFAATTFAVSMASALLYLAFKDDEDFRRREQWDRDAYWWFKLGDTAYRLPKPFEIGALGTLAERLVEQLADPEAGGELFAERLGFMLKQTFSFDPVPQLFRPALNVYANQDPFTRRPIETLDMERLSPTLRRRADTSALAVGLSEAGLGKAGLSPVQIEHLARGYFGWLGAQALLVGDWLARPALGLPDKPAKLKDTPVVGDLIQSFAPDGRGSRYLTEFYDQLKGLRQVHADAMLLRRLGDEEGLRALVATRGRELAQAQAVEPAARTMAELGQAERAIANSRTLSGQEKQARIDVVGRQKEAIARRLRAALAP